VEVVAGLHMFPALLYLAFTHLQLEAVAPVVPVPVVTAFLIYQLTPLVTKSPPMVVVVEQVAAVILVSQEAQEGVGTGLQAMVAQQPKEVSQGLQGQLCLEIAEGQVIVPVLPAAAVAAPLQRVLPVRQLRLAVTAAMELLTQ
jgi:hypothetical protein